MPMGDRERAYTGRNVIVDFKLDVAGIAKCAMGPELRKGVTDIAEKRAKPYAIRISPPRSKNHSPTHRHYRDSFTVKTGSVVINEMRRSAARLWNLSGHAVIVEFGNGANNGKGWRVLGRTINFLNGPVVGELTSVRLDRQRLARKASQTAALLNASRDKARIQKERNPKTGRLRKSKGDRFRKLPGQ